MKRAGKKLPWTALEASLLVHLVFSERGLCMSRTRAGPRRSDCKVTPARTHIHSILMAPAGLWWMRFAPLNTTAQLYSEPWAGPQTGGRVLSPSALHLLGHEEQPRWRRHKNRTSGCRQLHPVTVMQPSRLGTLGKRSPNWQGFGVHTSSLRWCRTSVGVQGPGIPFPYG